MALRMAAALVSASPCSSASLISTAVMALSLNTSMLQLRSVLFAMAPAAPAPRSPRCCAAERPPWRAAKGTRAVAGARCEPMPVPGRPGGTARPLAGCGGGARRAARVRARNQPVLRARVCGSHAPPRCHGDPSNCQEPLGARGAGQALLNRTRGAADRSRALPDSGSSRSVDAGLRKALGGPPKKSPARGPCWGRCLTFRRRGRGWHLRTCSLVLPIRT